MVENCHTFSRYSQPHCLRRARRDLSTSDAYGEIDWGKCECQDEPCEQKMTLAECRQMAEDTGKPYFSYKRNGKSKTSVCFASDSCDETIKDHFSAPDRTWVTFGLVGRNRQAHLKHCQKYLPHELPPMEKKAARKLETKEIEEDEMVVISNRQRSLSQEHALDMPFVQDGWAAYGDGDGHGHGSGSGTGFGGLTKNSYETSYDFQIDTVKLCINTVNRGFSPQSCYDMSLALIEKDLYAHQSVWDTCITKGYDVLSKQSVRLPQHRDAIVHASMEHPNNQADVEMKLQSDFSHCLGCLDYGDDATYCLVKVRGAGGKCPAEVCSGFDTDVQQTCLTVADFDTETPNACSACQNFATLDSQRYCLFVSDHDCTVKDCESLAGNDVDRPLPQNSKNKVKRRLHDLPCPEGEEEATKPKKVAKGPKPTIIPAAYADTQLLRPETPFKDTVYHMCRQRIWDASLIIPQAIATQDSCSDAIDLAQQKSPLSHSLIASHNVGGRTSSSCGGSEAGQNIYFVDLAPGASVEIWMTWNNYESVHGLRWGGECPGSFSSTVNDDSARSDGYGCVQEHIDDSTPAKKRELYNFPFIRKSSDPKTDSPSDSPSDSPTDSPSDSPTMQTPMQTPSGSSSGSSSGSGTMTVPYRQSWTNNADHMQRAYFVVEQAERLHGDVKQNTPLDSEREHVIGWSLDFGGDSDTGFACPLGFSGDLCLKRMECTSDGADNTEMKECGQLVTGGETGGCYCYAML